MGILSVVKVELLKLFLSGAYWLASLLFPYDKHAVLLLSARSDSMSIGMSMIFNELTKAPDVTVRTLFYGRGRGQVSLLRQALKAVGQIASAGVIVVDDHCFPLNALYGKRKRNVTIQIWHAVGGFKKFGNAKDNHTRIPHKNYDYVCVNTKEDVPTYALSLGVTEAQVVVTGALQIQYIQEKFSSLKKETSGNSSKRKKIFFAPTYRTGGNEDLSVKMMRKLLARIASQQLDFDVVVSLHPYIDAGLVPEAHRFSRSLFYETLLTSDILITDYSSLVIDYSITQKPIVLWTPDLEDYQAKVGFYEAYDIVGGLTAVRNLEQLLRILQSDQQYASLQRHEAASLKRLTDQFFTGADATGNICRLITDVIAG